MPSLPPRSCDCHVHIAGDPRLYPTGGVGPAPPADATLDSLLALHDAAGIERGVIVQPGYYRRDHRLLIAAIANRPSYRGIALIGDSITDREIRTMHEAGVRGARFVFWKRMEQAPSPAEFRRSVARIADYGWHVKIHAVGEEWIELRPLFDEIRIPAVIEHMANIDLGLGVDQPGFRFMAEMLGRENWWVLVSNGHRRSALASGWEDVVPIARRIVEMAPERTIWASDWPHLGYTRRLPAYSELVDLLYRFAPEEELRRKILVDNPARLIGFPA